MRSKIHAPILCVLVAMIQPLSGCSPFPVVGTFQGAFRGDANVATTVQGSLEVKVPPIPDAGPLLTTVVRPSPLGPQAPRVAILDVDGLILNQNPTGLLSLGENPVAAFREKLQAAACDARVKAVVLRINSPGGGVTASDILAEDLRKFRLETGKPVVACLMDLATGGAYYLAIGADILVAHPTTITGGVGAILNLYNLDDAMGAMNISAVPLKSGKMVDMGNITIRETMNESRGLLQEMTDGFGRRFQDRVARLRPAISPADRKLIDDGRVVVAAKAVEMRMVDRLGYLDDAIGEAERLGSASGSEVVQYRRAGTQAQNLYGIAPNVPVGSDLFPLSLPGLERSKMPTFLYLWQPDPTLIRQGGR